jgi:hypothetical protein
VTIRELWKRIFGEPEYVRQLRHMHEVDLANTKLEASREAMNLTTQLAALRVDHETELARMTESRDYFRQRMERYELMLHPGLVPRDPKAKREVVSVNSGARRQSWPQLIAAHVAEEFNPEAVEKDAKADKVRRDDIAKKSREAIEAAKKKMRERQRAAQSAELGAPTQEDSHEEHPDVQSA